MPVARRRAEETVTAGILGGEARHEIGADLVIVLADHRAEHGTDALARGAEPLHRIDGSFGDAGKRAAPAGVRGADRRRACGSAKRIGPQSAVRHADGEGGHARDDGVGARTSAIGHGASATTTCGE